MVGPGDVVTIYPAGNHYVYALLDDESAVFYIGLTNRPQVRLYQHLYGGAFGAPAVRAKLLSLREPRMLILSVHSDRNEAKQEERRQIDSRDDILNQEKRIHLVRSGPYLRLDVFEQFRKKDLDRVTGDPVT